MKKEKEDLSYEYVKKRKPSKVKTIILMVIYFSTLFSLGSYIKNEPEEKEKIVKMEILLPNEEVAVIVEGNIVPVIEKEEV